MPTSERSNDCNGNVRALEQRDFLIRWGRRCGTVALAAALAFAGWRGYGAWRQQRLAKQTQQFVERGDYRSAVLVARRLLAVDSSNLIACRAMAEMAEKSGKVDAVAWRQRVAHAEPHKAENQIALARAALRFGELHLAERICEALPDSARKSVEFHQVMGSLALARKQSAQAEIHFAAAAQLDPSDLHLSVNLAILRLTSVDPNVVEQARTILTGLTSDPRVQTEALRALSAYALTQSPASSAQKWTAQLVACENATLSDAFLHFQAVQGTEAAHLALERLKAKAAYSPATTAELITWLNRHEMAIVAAYWGTYLPREILETQPVPLAIAESYSFLQDWVALRAWVEGKNWGNYEALRLAVESHALHRLNGANSEPREAKTLWRAALKAAQTRPEHLIAIAQLAEGWGYRPDAEEAWWMIANSNANAKIGLTKLQRLYTGQQDTHGLLRVAKRALELNPGDLVAANNCASLGLLLNGDGTSRRLAEKLHAEHPANRAFATTYAYALHTEGKLTAGLHVMDNLKEEELRHPAIASYYVVMLVDNGQLERARSFLANAQSATLLPEEQRLLAAATRKLLASETAALTKSVAGSSVR